jgi:DtxR family Mn-dependent transcriptional regulator
MSASDTDSDITAAVGDYLKAIWSLAGDDPVTTKDLADRLGVAAASVSGMLVRLHEMDLVHHEPYRGARLQPAGRREALRIVRRHRLIETFLVEQLGYAWDEVHAEAEVLEHALSDRFVERLDELLDHPTHDPHGDPIPTAAGAFPDTPAMPLTIIPAGTRFAVSRLRTQDSGQLAHLADIGIVPGSRLTVESADDGEVLTVSTDTGTYRVAHSLAERVEGAIVD